jgi:hypothetical protein
VFRKLALAFSLLALALGISATAVRAQSTPEVKEKPPMYTYVSIWTIPRANWAEMAVANASDTDTMAKALASGAIVAYGHDTALVHTVDGPTHDEFWSSMSMAGLLSLLDQFYKNGSAANPVLSSATKHYDEILVSRYYNWTSGSCKGCYTHGGFYKLKEDAPNDAVETLSKSLFVPLFEKLLADGTIKEYEIDVQAIHTSAPGSFAIFYITPTAEGLDKVNDAIRDAGKNNPLLSPALGSMLDSTGHRDELTRTDATYK